VNEEEGHMSGAPICRILGTTLLMWLCISLTPLIPVGTAQSNGDSSRENVRGARPVTIPLTIKVKGTPREVELQTVDLTVTEDGDPQTILSIRALGTNSPLNLFLLIQDDVVPSIGLEIRPLANFIRNLPRGSRVSIGYVRTGTLQVRQKFTLELERAAKSLRIPQGVSGVAPYNPYVEVIEH
jgi:hypothetical protein